MTAYHADVVARFVVWGIVAALLTLAAALSWWSRRR